MTQDQFLDDIETLESIFESPRFPKTIQDEWGIEGDYQKAVFIPFIHSLTKNDAEILTRLKFHTLSQKVNLLRKAERIKEEAERAADTIEKLKNDGDTGLAEQIEKISSFLNGVSVTAENLYKGSQAILSAYSRSRLRTIKRHAGTLSMAESHCNELISGMKGDQCPKDCFQEIARTLEATMTNVSDRANDLLSRIEEIDKQIDDSIDSLLQLKTTSRRTGKKRTSSTASLRTFFITHLFSLFLKYIGDDNRREHKDECYNLYDWMTRDPGLEALLTQVYKVGHPSRFRHDLTTDNDYEKFTHDTTEPRPKNVLKFEEKIRKTWHCHRNGNFYLDGNIEEVEDESVLTFIEEYIKSGQEDGYKVDYIYLSPDFKLTFTCKSKDEDVPQMAGHKGAVPATGQPASRRRFFYVLTFRDDPSTFRRSLQKKKIMGDYLWDCVDTQKQATELSPDLSYDQVIKEAVAMYDKYGLSLSRDFLMDQLVDTLTNRLRSDALMPVIRQYIDNLTSDFERLFRFLTRHEDEGPDFSKKQLMEALGTYPVSAAESCDMSLLERKKLLEQPLANSAEAKNSPTIIGNITTDIETALAKYAFITKEETELREEIKKGLITTVWNTLSTLDLDTLRKSLRQNMVQETSGFMSTLRESKTSKLQDYNKHFKEIMGKSDALLDKIMPLSSIRDLIDSKMVRDNTLDKEKSLLLNVVILRSQLKDTLYAQPEKLLERYDFRSPIDDWRKKTTHNILRMILGACAIDQIINKNGSALKTMIFENEEFRRAIESAIRKNWTFDDKDEKDLTTVIMAFINYMTKGNLDKLYAIRRGFVDRESEYFPVPMLIYEEKAPKRWREYNEDDHSLADAFAEHAESFLKKTRKNAGQTTEIYKLLNNDDQNRIEELWGDGTKYDKMISDALSEIKKTGYRFPTDLDHDSVKRALYDFLLRDTKSLLSDYDFSDALANWVNQRVKYFVEGFPRIQCVLGYDRNMDVLIDEYKVNLMFMHQKYKIYDDQHIDDQFSATGFTHSIRGEETLTENDHIQDFAVQLSIDEKKIFRNFRFESSLKTYLMRANEYQSKNKLRDIIRKRARIKKKPTKKQQKELAKADKLRRGQEALKLLDILKMEGMRSIYSEGSNNESYLLKLLIYEMVYAKEMSKKDIITALVNDYHYSAEYVKKNYDKFKQRSNELIKNAQKINNQILEKHLKKEKLKKEEVTILEIFWDVHSVENNIRSEFVQLSSTNASVLSQQIQQIPLSSDDLVYD